MEMTLTYARIADRVVADEYEAVTAQIDALYNTAGDAGTRCLLVGAGWMAVSTPPSNRSPGWVAAR